MYSLQNSRSFQKTKNGNVILLIPVKSTSGESSSFSQKIRNGSLGIDEMPPKANPSILRRRSSNSASNLILPVPTEVETPKFQKQTPTKDIGLSVCNHPVRLEAPPISNALGLLPSALPAKRIKLSDGRVISFCGSISLKSSSNFVKQIGSLNLNKLAMKFQLANNDDTSPKPNFYHNYSKKIEQPAVIEIPFETEETPVEIENEVRTNSDTMIIAPAYCATETVIDTVTVAAAEVPTLEVSKLIPNVEQHKTIPTVEDSSKIPQSSVHEGNFLSRLDQYHFTKTSEFNLPGKQSNKRKFNSILDEYRFSKHQKVYEKMLPPTFFGVKKMTTQLRKQKMKLAFPKIKREMETQTDPSITHMYECCRHLPYNGMRKERNWFYFYMHECRNFLPKLLPRPLTTSVVDLRRTKLKSIRCQRMPTASLQFRHLKTSPPFLTVKKSRIHRIGVFAEETLSEGTFLIEYLGEVVRNSLVENRERQYRQKGFGSYMFRLDKNFTIDATFKGCIARFINHSCEPNCVAKVVAYDTKKHIVLIASKNIKIGDEICYDYKMPKEEEKMPCLCDSLLCRKFIN